MGSVGGSYQYNVVCDVCNFVYKNHELRKRWDGLMVCKYDWEPRHPMDFFKPRNDTHVLPYVKDDVLKIRCHASISADATPTLDAWTTLPLDEEISDTLSEYNTGTYTYQPSVTESRTLSFGVCISSTGGSGMLEIALYKNGNAVKTISPITVESQGEFRVGGSYVDTTATTSDQYLVKYKVSAANATIKAYDSGTFLRVD